MSAEAVEVSAESSVEPTNPVEASRAADAAADNDSAAAALAILAEARAARAKDPDGDGEATPNAEAVAAEPPTAEQLAAGSAPKDTPAVEKPAADPKAEELLSRLNKAEARAREAEAAAKAQADRIAKAERWEAAARKAKEGDASDIFNQLEWTVDTVNKYLQGGPDALKPTIAEQKAGEAKSEVEKLRAELAAERNQRTVETYRGQMLQELAQLTDKTPTLSAYYTDPDKGTVDFASMRDAVWQYQVQMYNRRGADGSPDPIELTPAQAAEALEELHSQSAKRYQSRKLVAVDPAKSGTGSAPQPVAPATKTRPLTKLPAPKTEKELEAEAENDALATLAAARKARLAAVNED